MSNKKIVYIAHQIGGNVGVNLAKIKGIFMELTYANEVVPFAPYLTGFDFLDDDIPHHRALGLANNKAFFDKKSFDELWLFGNGVTIGMQNEIEWAYKQGIPVIACSVATSEWMSINFNQQKQ